MAELARGPATKYTANYENDRDYLLGVNHWPTPRTYTQMAPDAWKAKTVRNWLFRTVDHKRAVVLDATPSIHVEPLTDAVPLELRAKIAQVTEHELNRLQWDDMAEAAFWDGAVCGKGLTMCRTERDKFTGEHKIRLDRVDPRQFFPDPSSDSLNNARFVVWEPELDLSVIKDIFPEKGPKVQAGKTQPINMPGFKRSRSVDEIIYAPGQEIALGDGKLQDRKATVTWVWIKDDSVSEDTEEVVLSPSRDVNECQDCGSLSDTESCPNCGSENMATQQVPADVQRNQVFSRMYPYGRLIVYSGDVLLYDGENPYSLDTVFPFAEYVHYYVPGKFWGFGDVSLLKSAQMVADKNMAQALDAQRMTAMGYFEYPAEALAYAQRGNAPGQGFPVPVQYTGRARWLTPQGYNAQLHSMVDEINLRDFERMGGVSDVSTGTSPNAPTSGVEVQARQRAAATRTGMHLKRLNRYRGQVASLVWKVMNQYYTGPKTFLVQQPTGEHEAIEEDVSQLPPGVAVRVDADLDAIEKDKLMGQNLTAAVQSGVLTDPKMRPFLPMYLTGLGFSPTVIKQTLEIVDQVAQAQAAAPPPPVVPPDDLLVAISDLLKVSPDTVSFEQVQQALVMAGLQPIQPTDHKIELAAPATTNGDSTQPGNSKSGASSSRPKSSKGGN